MEQFDSFVQKYAVVIWFAYLYSVLRYGKKNRNKYERWDRLRKEQRKKKWKRK